MFFSLHRISIPRQLQAKSNLIRRLHPSLETLECSYTGAKAGDGDYPLSSAFKSNDQFGIIAEAQPKRRRKKRKSMNRRKVQNGTVGSSAVAY
jgi:hypothetical protein